MLTLDYSKAMPFVAADEIEAALQRGGQVHSQIVHASGEKSDDLGWLNVGRCADDELVGAIEAKAAEIRRNADVFVLIGVGGSNQGARAVIEAFTGKGAPQVLYAGNNLSPRYLSNIMAQLEGKSVYVNVIAKNFATLEPGVHFRVIRQWMEKTYGVDGAGERIVATGSLNGSLLEMLGRQKRYTLLPFPLDIGGRYSVLSAVGLLPIAVAGVDIHSLRAGARDMEMHLWGGEPAENIAIQYAVVRNLLLARGYSVEILSYFEPAWQYFAKWWVQLFGESEGKEGKGLYPTACSFTEDLHSLGQYIQQGQRIICETFLHLVDQGAGWEIDPEPGDVDGFGYLDGKDFAGVNETAYRATLDAHHAGGVPCLVVNVPELSPYYMGQLFYFFEFACFASGLILGVNPFDQPGVEAYKANMLRALKNPDA